MLSLSVSLNALSVHGTCTAVFVAVAAVATALVSSIQTLGRIKLLGWAGVASILSAGEFEVEGASSALRSGASKGFLARIYH